MTRTLRFARISVLAVLSFTFVACVSKKEFEQLKAENKTLGEEKVRSMGDLVSLKTVPEGRRTTIQATEMRCTKSGDLMKIEANLNNDSSKVKRIAYKFRWIDREGMRAAEEEFWKPLLLYENSNYVVSAVAPSNKAVDFRLILMSQE